MNRVTRLFEGSLSFEDVIGRDLRDEEQKRLFEIATNSEFGTRAQNGVDMAISHGLALRGLNPNEDSTVDVYREQPVIFSHDNNFDDKGLLRGYVSMMKFLARVNGWEKNIGRFAYEPTPYTVIKTPNASLIGQSLEVRNDAEMAYALPDVAERYDAAVDLGHIPEDTEFISAYVVYAALGKNIATIRQVEANDAALQTLRNI